jgi:hypothetical protein
VDNRDYNLKRKNAEPLHKYPLHPPEAEVKGLRAGLGALKNRQICYASWESNTDSQIVKSTAQTN